MQATVVGTSFRQVTPQIAISLHFPQPLRAMLVSSHSKENHPKKLKSGTSVLKWRKITIFLHFAATIEVPWSSALTQPILSSEVLLPCYAYTSNTAISWLEYTARKRQNPVTIRLASATFADLQND